jgi:Flp pilus assembly protein TadD
MEIVWYNKDEALRWLGSTCEADAAYAKAKELGYNELIPVSNSTCNP